MTFHFHHQEFRPAKKIIRPRPVASWRVGDDGRLECRWTVRPSGGECRPDFGDAAREPE